MACGGCGGGSGDAAKEMRQLEEARQLQIDQGLVKINEAFKGFDQGFYNDRQNAYIKYAMPQVSEQFRQVNRQNTFNLAGRGLTQSSAAQRMSQLLSGELNRQKQGVADTGLEQAQNLRREVESNRSQLITQLQSSADQNSAGQQALASAATFSAPSVMQPVGNLFSNFANLYMANAMNNASTGGANYSLLPRGGATSSIPSTSGNYVK